VIGGQAMDSPAARPGSCGLRGVPFDRRAIRGTKFLRSRWLRSVVIVALLLAACTTVCTVGKALPAAADSAWTSQSTPPGIFFLNAVSCPSSTTCYAISFDEIAVTTDAGLTWNLAAAPPSGTSSGLNSISCPTTTDCTVVDTESNHQVITTTNGGATWTTQAIPVGATPSASPVRPRWTVTPQEKPQGTPSWAT